MKYMRELRRKYCDSVIAFLCLLTVLVGGYALTITFNIKPIHEGYVTDRAITAFIPDKGTFRMEPDLLVHCGKPPAPMDWNFFTEDGTINQKKVLEFSAVLTEWDECATEYATIIRAYAASTEILRDIVMESAGNFFLEFAPDTMPDMHEEIPGWDEEQQPGTFQCDTCHEDIKR